MFSNFLQTPVVLYSDCLRRERNFLASARRVTALCMPVCCILCVCDGYTQAYVQIMQHMHMHKAVTGRVEAKKLLSRRRQSNCRCSPNIQKNVNEEMHCDLCEANEVSGVMVKGGKVNIE